MNMKAWAALCLVALLAGGAGVGAARILALFTIPGRSHFIVTSSLARALAERGHAVTVVAPFPAPDPALTPANYTHVTIGSHLDQMGDTDFYALGDLPAWAMLLFMWRFGAETCRLHLADPALQAIIHSRQRFDLVLLEAFFSDCLIGFAHHFDVPVVQMCAHGGATWMGDWVGNPSPPSHVPDPLLGLSDRMSFGQRAANALLAVVSRAGRALYYEPRADAAMREGFGDPAMPPLAALERQRTALVLVNAHVSLSPPRPAVPAFVQVGGLHIAKPQPLPEELSAWLSASPAEGFVYMSMGSNLRSADMPPAKSAAFLQVFGALRLRVLWKWEEQLPDCPPNVRTSKWLPQQDVLAHPKLRLFLTHGGLMSTQEAVYHGVPVLGLPVYGDQAVNMQRAEEMGFGVALRFQDVTVDSLNATLQRALASDSLRASARHLSALFHDRPLAPMEEAVWWTEHVLRHGGAPHLRSAAVHLPWHQYLLLDVLVALAVAAGVAGAAAWLAVRALLRCVWPRRPRAPAPRVSAPQKRD